MCARTRCSLTTVILSALGLIVFLASLRMSVNKQRLGQLQPVAARDIAISSAVSEALVRPTAPGYAPVPHGVRLLSLRAEGPVITLNFSDELIANGTGAALEDALHQIFVTIDTRLSYEQPIEYRVLINGRPLEQYR